MISKGMFEVKNTYDVVVVGGGLAGICAAVSSAREGAKTALIERYGILGGMLTSGNVYPILGMVSEGTIYDEVAELLGADSAEKIVSGNGREIPVDVEKAKSVLLKFARDNQVDIWLQTPVVEAQMEDGRLTGVLVGTQEGLKCLEAKVFIDASGDGQLAAIAGAPYEIGRAGDGKCQPVSMIFTVGGVDPEIGQVVNGRSDKMRLPDGTLYADVCEAANQRGELPPNVTIVRLHRSCYPDERNVNASQANGYNTLTADGVTAAELDLKGQIDQIVTFLRKYVPGYEKCYVKSSGSTLGVRETRRITGECTVTDEDVEQGRKHPDVVVHNAWFKIDIHNPAGGGQAEKYAQPCIPYDIRYGSLVPLKVDGLLTAGRCISGTHRAHASYRVMGICMGIGQAAGIAAALCAEKNCVPRVLDVREVQKKLTQKGVDLGL
ncbi:MAG: FAD-dependent oxidoreductase [Lachnospiraceae bacterium]|nr:FAD-dependent oxidoreductase [Lachnospiraceae bacterium]